MVTRFTALKNRFIFRLRKIVGGELPLETETCRFVLISLLDLFMTFLLLYFSNRGMMRNVVVESNPVARYFISGWGTMGLFSIKIGMETLIQLATQYVATRRPSVAQLKLNGATLFVGSVVACSAFTCSESDLNAGHSPQSSALLGEQHVLELRSNLF